MTHEMAVKKNPQPSHTCRLLLSLVFLEPRTDMLTWMRRDLSTLTAPSKYKYKKRVDSGVVQAHSIGAFRSGTETIQ